MAAVCQNRMDFGNGTLLYKDEAMLYGHVTSSTNCHSSEMSSIAI